jgi:hypothetical protein
MRAFNLVTSSNTAGAAYATVMIQPIALVRRVYRRQFGAPIFEPGMIDPELGAPCPQFAAAVGHANRTYVIAFREQEFQDHFAVFHQLFGMGLDHHAIHGFRGTGGQKPSGAFHLHEAQPAGPHRRQTFKITERREVNSVLAACLQQGRPGWRAHLYTIYRQSYD